MVRRTKTDYFLLAVRMAETNCYLWPREQRRILFSFFQPVGRMAETNSCQEDEDIFFLTCGKEGGDKFLPVAERAKTGSFLPVVRRVGTSSYP